MHSLGVTFFPGFLLGTLKGYYSITGCQVCKTIVYLKLFGSPS